MTFGLCLNGLLGVSDGLLYFSSKPNTTLSFIFPGELQNSNRSSQRIRHRRPTQRNPNRQLIRTNLLRRAPRRGRSSTRERNRDLDIASISTGSNSDTDKFASVIVVAKIRFASIEGHAVLELDSGVVMFDGDDGPCGESGQFLEDCLDPDLEETKVAGLVADGGGWHVGGAHVGLVEHEGVVSEGEQMADINGSGIVEQGGEAVGASGGGDPFVDGAIWSIAVVVDGGGLERLVRAIIRKHVCKTHPSWHDDQSSVSIVSYSSNVRPVLVDGVLEDRSCVVTNDIEDAIVHPGLDHITVMKTSDRWWDKTIWREMKGSIDGRLVHPGSVEHNLLVGIGECCVVQ